MFREMLRSLWMQIPATMKIVWGMYLLSFFTILAIIAALGLKLYMKF